MKLMGYKLLNIVTMRSFPVCDKIAHPRLNVKQLKSLTSDVDSSIFQKMYVMEMGFKGQCSSSIIILNYDTIKDPNMECYSKLKAKIFLNAILNY